MRYCVYLGSWSKDCFHFNFQLMEAQCQNNPWKSYGWIWVAFRSHVSYPPSEELKSHKHRSAFSSLAELGWWLFHMPRTVLSCLKLHTCSLWISRNLISIVTCIIMYLLLVHWFIYPDLSQWSINTVWNDIFWYSCLLTSDCTDQSVGIYLLLADVCLLPVSWLFHCLYLFMSNQIFGCIFLYNHLTVLIVIFIYYDLYITNNFDAYA